MSGLYTFEKWLAEKICKEVRSGDSENLMGFVRATQIAPERVKEALSADLNNPAYAMDYIEETHSSGVFIVDYQKSVDYIFEELLKEFKPEISSLK
jgi:hypothetical protein